MEKKVYKILTAKHWSDFKKAGIFEGSSADLEDGFIHLSTQKQLARIIKKYFSGVRPIYLVEFSSKEFLRKLKWEAASNGDLYPHLYDEPLRKRDINHVEEVFK